ncbi:polysaccharide biosynthesis protein [Chroococcidiopsis sp. CCALA 051]|uniref:oligosaccharide flippase family protein n=1 Tax=Chroococcidiopsis sp. CCALA 051 TaxID=869949 RepID=UPI000D0CCA7B|nr:oligosaccharide flippase family protein [Chroococcidiopsis sp. CCALA 051]MBE9015946.1 oligosaccharide flippase family protein [Chroococcidiopsidales cyanobacterium LEGE 13417]PSM48502.1 polysaccharide biosynthesis protein [Chroococcidiopsis sp. CCALA 051]
MATNKPLTLRRNFSWTFVGNIIYAACQWGIVVVLAKLGKPEMVGQFTLGLAVTAPVIMFTNLQLRAIQATDAKQQYAFEDYLGLRLITTGLALAIIIGIVFLVGYRWEISIVIFIIALAKSFEAISDVFYGLVQQHERMDRIAISMMIKGPLSLVVLGCGIYLTGNIVWGVIGLAVAWAIVLLSFDIHSGILMVQTTSNSSPRDKVIGNSVREVRLKPRWNWVKQKKLILLSLPLGFVMMLISLNINIPRYFIERYLGERELGFFAAIGYFMLAGTMVVNALGESANPRLAKYYATGDSLAFRTLLLKLVGIGISIGGIGVLVSVVAGRQILTLVYRPEYGEYTGILILLMLATAVNYVASLLGYGMTAARYFRIQIPLFALVTAISAVVCFLLIPHNGLQGAAIALLIAAVVQVILSLAVNLLAISKLARN